MLNFVDAFICYKQKCKVKYRRIIWSTL